MADSSLEALAAKKCRPCEGGTPPLNRQDAEKHLRALSGWKLAEDGKSIRADYRMKNFLAGIELISKIAAAAEADNHHPDLHLTGYRNLAVVLSTHAIGGLSENDLILAAKIERLPKKLK